MEKLSSIWKNNHLYGYHVYGYHVYEKIIKYMEKL